MKCQILFSRKIRKNISKCCLLKFYPECKVLKIDVWKIGSDTSCKLSPKEKFCMKCKILFSRKIR